MIAADQLAEAARSAAAVAAVAGRRPPRRSTSQSGLPAATASSSSRLTVRLADAARRRVDDPQQRDLVARIGQRPSGRPARRGLPCGRRTTCRPPARRGPSPGAAPSRTPAAARWCGRGWRNRGPAAPAADPRGDLARPPSWPRSASSSSCRIRGGSPPSVARSILAWRSLLKAISRLAQPRISRVER